jgi:hypothetical protein
MGRLRGWVTSARSCPGHAGRAGSEPHHHTVPLLVGGLGPSTRQTTQDRTSERLIPATSHPYTLDVLRRLRRVSRPEENRSAAGGVVPEGLVHPGPAQPRPAHNGLRFRGRLDTTWREADHRRAAAYACYERHAAPGSDSWNGRKGVARRRAIGSPAAPASVEAQNSRPACSLIVSMKKGPGVK